MNNDIHVVSLEKMTYGGETMGKLPDKRAVFVPYGLPGEKVIIRLLENKSNFAKGEILEVLEPSEHRITPRCSHFGRCNSIWSCCGGYP